MGGVLSCCEKDEQAKASGASGYSAVNGNNQAGESKNNNRDGAGQGVGGDNDEESMSMMHNAVGEHYGEDAFDKVRCACVFDILQIEQKFTSKQLYEKKYVWVNLAARSIHMSEHNSKDRRHKEASLSDVTDVQCRVPNKFKEGLDPTAEHCLTVVFKRGGGIDLKFEDTNTRDIWAETLLKIVNQQASAA